ncbi:hypothetical protein BDZ94DRAFT_1285207 [Collybia nuda]|uniref:Uncharacterized protein n=1 Tax=Collybia nuda TaxID=64659 RepID=A0A9P6CE17_9AGAR|nr:hypothetical protein BDZ94DRAFT_1285207 [Collybia nuda]
MLFWSPWLARTSSIYLLILLWLCSFQIAHTFALTGNEVNPSPSHAVNDTHPGLLCSPFGLCEPCPAKELAEPFCQPFGNRRLMHCTDAKAPSPSHDSSHSEQPPSHTQPQHPQGETLAWESCGRIVKQERADFYEFVACNVLFAIVALAILFVRSKRLHAMQARQLAARIGIIRNRGNGGRR